MADLVWLLLVTLGFASGWSVKGLMVERRACRWCDAPTVTPKADYCRRHSAELIAQLRAGEGRDGE